MKRNARWFGIAALLISLLALACTILSFHVLEEPRPRTHSKITVKVGWLKWERETKSPPNKPDLNQFVTPHQMRLAGIALAIVSVFLSAVSWIRHEAWWLGFAACTFAAAATAWIQFVVVFALSLFTGGLFLFLPPPSWAKGKDPA
jgi:hypothetical protein